MCDTVLEGSTPAEVIYAIEKYRAAAAAHSRECLEVLIRAGEEQELGPEWEAVDEAAITAEKLNICKQYLTGDLSDFKTPRELLSRFDELVDRAGLDGVVSWYPERSDADVRTRTERYIEILNGALQKNTHVAVPFSVSMPQEYKTLMFHVDSLHGLGLPIFHRGPSFYTGCFETESQIRSRVLSEEDIKFILSPCRFSGYEVAAGWRIDDVNDVRLLVMLCRNEAEGKPWRWRYVSFDLWGKETVKDDIPDFLEFFAQYFPLNARDWFIPLDEYPPFPVPNQ